MGVHFDTLEFVKTLTASGLPPAQAEAIARAHAKSLGDLVDKELATKGDLNVLRAELKADFKSEINGLRSETSSGIGSLRAEMNAGIGSLRAEMKSEIATLRSEMDSKLTQLRSELRADFQTELRSLKYAASIAMAFLSFVVVFSRFIR